MSTSENPYEAKRRWRWPRFKLSTILVLVGILAWAMASRPLWTKEQALMERLKEFDSLPIYQYADGRLNSPQIGTLSLRWKLERAIDTLQWPLLALAGFLTWKWIAARRKRPREAAPLSY